MSYHDRHVYIHDSLCRCRDCRRRRQPTFGEAVVGFGVLAGLAYIVGRGIADEQEEQRRKRLTG